MYPSFVICIEQRFPVTKSGASGLTSIFDLSKAKMKIQHASCATNWFKFARCNNSYIVVWVDQGSE